MFTQRTGRHHADPDATPPEARRFIQSAMVTWLPIGAGIVAGTLARGTTLLFGQGPLAAGVIALVCVALGTLLGLAWIRPEGVRRWDDGMVIGLTWLVLSALFRAVWLGAVIGRGAEDVVRDYSLSDGQPGIPILLLVALAPLTLVWLAHRRGPS